MSTSSRSALVVGAVVAFLAVAVVVVITLRNGSTSSDAEHSEPLKWTGLFGPPQGHGWQQLIFDGHTDQSPPYILATGPVHVSVTLTSGAGTEVMVLSAGHQVSPHIHSAKGTANFVLTSTKNRCPVPVLVYVRTPGASSPSVQTAHTTVTYTEADPAHCAARS
jgi:hypothetical protein